MNLYIVFAILFAFVSYFGLKKGEYGDRSLGLLEWLFVAFCGALWPLFALVFIWHIFTLPPVQDPWEKPDVANSNVETEKELDKDAQ